MKLKCIITGAFFLSVIISGCATIQDLPSAATPPAIDMQKVTTEIEETNSYLENGDVEKAQSMYQLIIDTYPELPVRYQCGLLTNAALASLQMGDGRRFIDYAQQLETVATAVRPLPRNTQIVLVMMQITGNRTTDSDLWISQPVESAVSSALSAK